MYKVFVNDKPLFLTNQVQKETDFKLFLLESVDIKNLIIKIFQNKIQKAFLYHPDEKLIMKTLRAKLPVEKAGGGLVYNKNGEVLFIFRNGKWDLAKGGMEKNETIEYIPNDFKNNDEIKDYNNLKKSFFLGSFFSFKERKSLGSFFSFKERKSLSFLKTIQINQE